MNKNNILKKAKQVLNIESEAINKLAKSLNESFFRAVSLIVKNEGKLIL